MARVRIGIDIMGGDFAPEATIDGSVLALPHLADKVDLVLIGDESLIKSKLQKHNLQVDTFEIVHAPENIEMGEHPTKALVKKPNSSIAV